MTTTATPEAIARRRVRTPDDDLAALVATGDSEAFEELYERYREPLLGCLHSALREPEDARDALQITMLNAFRALREGRVPEAVRPWLFTIARNAAISTTRRRVVQLELADDDMPIVDGPAEAVVERERVDRLLDDLGEMAPRRRQVVLMRAVQGLDYDEIGGELGISSAAARQTVREARVALDDTARGRDLRCEDVSTALERGDVRNARSRTLLAHLKACANCRRQLPLGSITRGQVAAILAGLLAVRTAVSKALALPAAAIESAAGASLTAKAISVAAVAITAGSGIVAGVHEHGGPSESRSEAPPAAAVLPEADQRAATQSGQASAEPRVGGPSAAAVEPTGRPVRSEPDQPIGSSASPARDHVQTDSAPASDGADDAQPTGANGELSSDGLPTAEPEQAAKREEQASDSPGASGSAPGHGGTPPGQGGTPPGQAGDSPGPSGSAPGHGGTPPGQGGTPPGQSTTPPGQAGTPPGQAGTPPGQAGTPPAQAGTPPGQASTASGQSSTPPGQAEPGDSPGASAAAPGHTNGSGDTPGNGK